MAHFLIINTGGTIGMVEGDNGLEPHQGEIENALNSTNEALKDWQAHELTWVHWNPLLDSSNLQPIHWYQIKDTIDLHPTVDGVLIIHGTDTLSYTASALSYLLSTLKIPVVITGSMLPISAPNTDAVDNLNLSLTALVNARPEVVAAVGHHILPGSRLTKTSTSAIESFETPGWQKNLWGQPFDNKPLVINKSCRPAAIGVITLYPGLPMDGLMSMVDRFYRAIVINAFGNGNAANENSFRRILKHAQEKRIPVFIRSQCPEGNVDFHLYAAGALFDEFGAISCGNMSFEAVITKLQILCSEFNRSEEVIEAFRQPIAREWQQ